jgi:hypothetical protein
MFLFHFYPSPKLMLSAGHISSPTLSCPVLTPLPAPMPRRRTLICTGPVDLPVLDLQARQGSGGRRTAPPHVGIGGARQQALAPGWALLGGRVAAAPSAGQGAAWGARRRRPVASTRGVRGPSAPLRSQGMGTP